MTRDSQDVSKEGLLTDEEFSELMAAEHTAAQHTVDEVAQRRMWQAIGGQLGVRVRKRSTAMVAWAAAALVCVGLGSLLLRRSQEDADFGQRIKGDAVVSGSALRVYRLVDGGEPVAVVEGDRLPLATTLVFKVAATVAGEAVLAQSDDAKLPRILLEAGPIAAGGEHTLALAGEATRAFAYKLDAEDRSPRFCLVSAADAASLRKLVADLPALWSKLPEAACVRVHAVVQP